MDYSDYINLKKYCYFSSLSDGALEAIANNLHAVEFPAGTEIIQEGTAGDAFYMVSQGEVEVLKKTSSGQMARLSVIGHGEGFGEMALLTSSPRSCSVIAKTPVKLLKLYKKDFEDIVRVDSAFSQIAEKKAQSYSQYNHIKTLEPFALLEPEKMAVLLDRMGETSYPSDTDIIVQGETGDVYYIVKSGSVAVLKKMFKDEPEQVATLYAGEGFGEEALITGQPRNATVRTVDKTTLWTLSKSDFDQIMKSSFLEEISPETVLNSKKENSLYLDVRMDMEFDEEHLPDAINIPLDELRKRYSDFDPLRQYYVYCLVGARSATATFLLRSRGINALSIKGGILNWPGPVIQGNEGVHTPFTPT